MIKIPVKVTYGVMATLDLALHYGALPVQAKVIAQRQAIPSRFIEQVLQSLKQAGVIDSLRGAQGGYSLRKSPDETTIAEIVEALNGHREAAGAVSNGQGDRPVVHERIVHSVWDQVRQAEHDILSSITLRSLVDQYSLLEQERAPMYHI